MPDAQEKWRNLTHAYVKAINEFVERGLSEGWENAGEEPRGEGREELAPHALSAVREANASGDFTGLREKWPPAYLPLLGLLDGNEQSIPTLCVLEDDSIIARIGASYENGYVVRIADDRIEPQDPVTFFGFSPGKEYFAFAEGDGIHITRGWRGEETAVLAWPTGTEDWPDAFADRAQPLLKKPRPTRLIPFAHGRKVLLISPDGIFLLSDQKARRVLPTRAAMEEFFRWLEKENPDDPLFLPLSMEHGAVSKNEKWIAAGCQDGTHLVFDADLNLVADIGTQSEYPHFAAFSQDDSMIIFNSCHFYNGMTVGIKTAHLPGLKTESYEEDERAPILEQGSRVYAAVHRPGEFIIGDANGYVRAFSEKGDELWTHFIGSTITAMDISADFSRLVVSTYAGFISIIDLDAGRKEPYQIGTGEHVETARWLFWKNEERPLRW